MKSALEKPNGVALPSTTSNTPTGSLNSQPIGKACTWKPELLSSQRACSASN
jgi:hypothetical protein